MVQLSEHLYTAQQVREGEKSVAFALNITMYELMERAGKAAFDAVARHYPDCRNLYVYCGAGNNGGDGYVVARHAKELGYSVTLYQFGDTKKLTEEANRAKENWLKAGGAIANIDTDTGTDTLPNDSVIIDALLGTGLKGQVREEYVPIIERINKANADVISVDIPTGLCADTGTVLGCCVKATHTIAFIGLKQGLFSADAPDYVGNLIFSGLGISKEFDNCVASSSTLISKQWVEKQLPRRSQTAHKGSNGRVLCLGGDRGMFGAIRLTSEACLRSGAGLTRVVTQLENVSAIVSARPELMVYDWRGNSNEINGHLEWCDVIALGPGLGQSSWGRSLAGYSRSIEKPIVADADGVNILAKMPDFNSHRVITPHPGEAARLLNTTIDDIQSDRFSSVQKLQRKYGGVVVLKGAGTLVCDGERIWVCNAGNPGMASGGMGDVLTGIIAGLLAQGLSLSSAAVVGVWIHSTSADLASKQLGEIGLLASDLFPYIRRLTNGMEPS